MTFDDDQASGPCGGPDGAQTTLVIGTRQPESVDEASGCLVQLHGEGLGSRIELRSGNLLQIGAADERLYQAKRLGRNRVAR